MSMSQRTREQAGTYMRMRVPFKRASLRAEKFGPFRKGYLTDEEYSQLLSDEPSYIVYSYETPIAWVTPSGAHVIDRFFSKTTSAHQELARENL